MNCLFLQSPGAPYNQAPFIVVPNLTATYTNLSPDRIHTLLKTAIVLGVELVIKWETSVDSRTSFLLADMFPGGGPEWEHGEIGRKLGKELKIIWIFHQM